MYQKRDDYSFALLADGKRFHHFKGATWQAIVSEDYLALHKMKRFAEFYRQARAENRRVVDSKSSPFVMSEMKDFFVRSLGESFLNHTEAPGFAVRLTHQTAIVLKLGDVTVRVTLPNQRPEPDLDPYTALDTFPNVARLPEGGGSLLMTNTYSPPEFHVYSAEGTSVVPDQDLVELFAQVKTAREIQIQECGAAYSPYLEWLSESGRQDRAKMRAAKRVSELDARSKGLLRSHLTGIPGLLERFPTQTVTEFINADPEIVAVYPIEHLDCNFRWSTGANSGMSVMMSQLWALPAAQRLY